MTVYLPTLILDLVAPSRASPLPQGLRQFLVFVLRNYCPTAKRE
jgi:hypothetical protein